MIGYYVHHQGHGHLHRMQSISRHLRTPMTVLSSLPPDSERPWVQLPLDNLAVHPVDPTAHGTLHWVPRHDQGLRRRMTLVAEWIDRHDPDLVVVDVSVEVAALCRLLGVPVIVAAMRGDRSDRAHLLAYDAAHALLAPWSAEFADLDWPDRWRDKTFHAGAISRFADRPLPAPPAPASSPRVLFLWGAGGIDRPDVESAVAASPGWEWRIADGHADVWGLLSWADVVVTHAGQNAVAEVAAAGRPAVVIADDRPHGEQSATAALIQESGVSLGLPCWPAPDRWPDLLTAAAEIDGRQWRRWTRGDGAHGAARFLDETVAAVRAATGEDVG